MFIELLPLESVVDAKIGYRTGQRSWFNSTWLVGDRNSVYFSVFKYVLYFINYHLIYIKNYLYTQVGTYAAPGKRDEWKMNLAEELIILREE